MLLAKDALHIAEHVNVSEQILEDVERCITNYAKHGDTECKISLLKWAAPQVVSVLLGSGYRIEQVAVFRDTIRYKVEW
jgi:hypothetical protein